jgi:hypothetical protein
MRLNANQYTLELAKEGAKLTSTYDMSTILETTLEKFPTTTNVPFPPHLPKTNLGLPLPSSSYQPMNNTSLLQALQNHPFVNTQNLEANTVLEISPNTFTLLTFNNSTIGSVFKATPYDPNGPPDRGNLASLTNSLGPS